jgi:NADH-quinone oxidoreductase subunit L
MLLPLLLLAVGSFAGGYVRIPYVVEPAFRLEAAHGEHPGWVPIAATANALLGIALAYWMYLKRTDLPGTIGTALAPLKRTFENKYGFDIAYDGFARNVVVKGSESVLWKAFDAGFIDGLVNGVARATGGLGARARLAQTGLVRAYALAVLGGAVALLGYLLWS